MTKERRSEEIQRMLADDALYIGAAPITRVKINCVRNILTSKGTLSKHETAEIRTQMLGKKKPGNQRCRLGQVRYSWNNSSRRRRIRPNILQILQHRRCSIHHIPCQEPPRDPTGQGPRLVTHIDRRAKARFQAINAVAKSVREQSKFTVQTNIRIGKNDYLLRQRQKGSNTPWQQVPPVIINKKNSHPLKLECTSTSINQAQVTKVKNLNHQRMRTWTCWKMI